METQEAHWEEYLTSAWETIFSLRWYAFAVAVLAFYYSTQIKEKYDNWKRKRDEREYAAKYHKNPDLLQERLSGMEAARQRMQEKYIRDAEIARQKEEERIEKKKQELLNLTEGTAVGQILGTKEGGASTSQDKGSSKSKLKKDYNPLMGDGGGGYRAPKRSCCGKGGCG